MVTDSQNHKYLLFSLVAEFSRQKWAILNPKLKPKTLQI